MTWVLRCVQQLLQALFGWALALSKSLWRGVFLEAPCQPLVLKRAPPPHCIYPAIAQGPLDHWGEGGHMRKGLCAWRCPPQFRIERAMKMTRSLMPMSLMCFRFSCKSGLGPGGCGHFGTLLRQEVMGALWNPCCMGVWTNSHFDLQ